MSHQSGITASPELLAFFAKAKRPKSTSVRVMQIVIQGETLVLKQHINVSSSRHRSWSDEYDELVLPLLDPQSPCYIIYRTDTQDADASFRWLFVLWSPDGASVREKMLYASTKATLKREFGEGHIENELFGTTRSDVNLKAYRQARRMSSDGDLTPLTHAEREMRALRLDEAERAAGGHHHHHHQQNHIHISHHHVHLSSSKSPPTHDAGAAVTVTSGTAPSSSLRTTGVSFPMAEDAVRAVDEFVRPQLNYVQFSMDLLNEKVLLESSKPTLQVAQLASAVPHDKPRYHLYRFTHVHSDGQRHEPVFFIYSVPSDFSACPVKDRMIYSACKNPLVEQLQYGNRVHIDKKLEVSSEDLAKELSETALRHETHATAARATHADEDNSGRSRSKFDKPQGPTGARGPRRLVR